MDKERKYFRKEALASGVVIALLFMIYLYASANFDELKYKYKTWLAHDKISLWIADYGDNLIEEGYGREGLEYVVWGGMCRLFDNTSCIEQYTVLQSELQKKLALPENQDTRFTERTWQVGVDRVTTLQAIKPEDWINWGVMTDGTMVVVTEIGQGRKVEVITDNEIEERLQAGLIPDLLYRMEEDDETNDDKNGIIQVAKTVRYTGVNFNHVATHPEFLLLGIDRDEQLVFTRGGQRSPDDYQAGTRLYWPLDLTAPTFEDALISNNSMDSYISSLGLHCGKSPSYSCIWTTAIAGNSDGDIFEIRVPRYILKSDHTWGAFVEYVTNRFGINEIAFADPMYQDSDLTAADTVISRDVWRNYMYEDPSSVLPEEYTQEDHFGVNQLREDGVEDGLFVVVWNDITVNTDPVLVKEETVEVFGTR